MTYIPLKILLITLSVLMCSFSYSDSVTKKGNDFIRLDVLSGVEAEVVRVAVERFRSEKLNITPHGYDVSVYLNGEDYIVFFERSKNAPLGTIDLSYEAVVSGKSLKVLHSQFSR